MFKEYPILGPENQAVTVNPDFVIRDRSDEDQFIIVACDGIWDAKTCDEAVEYISEKVESQGGLKKYYDLTDPIGEMLESINAKSMPARKGET